MTEFIHRPGFLGTNANFAADMTLLLSILVMAIFSYGFVLARQGSYDTHKWVQSSGAVLNLVLVLWLMILPYRDFILRDSGGPRDGIFYIVTTVHATVGVFAFFLGNFVVLRGHSLVPKRLRFKDYKLFMRTAYSLYFLTTAFGIGTYWYWFVASNLPPVF